MAIVDKLIHTYKTRKKRSFLQQPLYHSRRQYAFIGVGMHSLANLYPILHYFQVPLKYIYTDNSGAAEELASKFPGATATHRLEDILQDPEVAGVFVCAAPASHFSITRQLLQAGKNVFVEKPPCHSLSELTTLIGLTHSTKGGATLTCMPGLQKRFGAVNRLLKDKVRTATHYHYTYGMGPYPEGDPIYELFIHPIDNCIQLFGPAKVSLIKNIHADRGSSFILVLEHANRTGAIELSTAYNWNHPADNLVIHTNKEILTARYPNFIQGEEKSGTLAGIPLEKIGNRPVLTRTYLNNDGTIPSMENSNLYIQGFYGAISHFIRAVEEGKADGASQIDTLYPVFEILDALKTASAKRS
jgi:virulence factor